MQEQGSNTSRPQVHRKHPDLWQRDLNPNQLAGQNIGPASSELPEDHATAFHLRKSGHPVGDLDDDELKQVPLVPRGTRLQQGATYVNLTDEEPYEFTARGHVTAQPGDAFAPKDRVPYEIWNRLIGDRGPGGER
jgi:hypothetical protein